ncbi:MAG: hypothetical protein ACRD3J_28770 [Thermoanaerobaculia bacterium]
MAQYQLHAAIFQSVSAVVVSHFVKRAVANNWIAVERWNRVGINRLRLTTSGRRLLIAHGADPASLFTPRRPVATKDMAHTLWINDLRVVFLKSEMPFDRVVPAWQLQRRLSPPPAAIPDVLAIRQDDASGEASGEAGIVCACEVDLGGERLARVFLPKLIKLNDLVRDWSGGARSSVVVLTRGAQRAASIREFLATGAREHLESVVHELPSSSGIDGLASLRKILSVVVTVKQTTSMDTQ